MEIKPTGQPAAAPEPDDTPAASPAAGPAKAEMHVAPMQDHLEVYVPPKLDLGHGKLGRLPDPSDLGKLRHDLRSELPADIGTGPAENVAPTPCPHPEPPPPPPDFVSKFRNPMINPAAFSPEVGGTEKGPQGTPKRPAIQHGIGPGHFTTPHPGDKGTTGPGGFHVPSQPHPTDPRASAPVEPPGPQPSPPDPPKPSSASGNLAFSGPVAGQPREGIAGYQDGDDFVARSGLIAGQGRQNVASYQDGEDIVAPTGIIAGGVGAAASAPVDPPDPVPSSASPAAQARISAAMQGETFGVQDPGPPTGPRTPPDPPPKPD
jgi:hypothetical protein